jgi:hypothetical protein
VLTDDELRRVMNPPTHCACGALFDVRRHYEPQTGELCRSVRICGRCGFIEREWVQSFDGTDPEGP